MSIFQRLGYNFDDPENIVGRLSDGAIKYLDSFPPILKEWQLNDLANNEVGGYFQNPVANSAQEILNTSITLSNLISADPSTNTNGVTGFDTVNTVVSNIATSTAEKFIVHTNRMSGVAPLTGLVDDGLVQPHYQTGIGVGRLLLVLTHQTDNIINSAPVLGSFTSLFIANTLSNLSNSLSTYFDLVNGSITVSGAGTEEDPFVQTSSLSISTIQEIENTVIEIENTMNTRREHDVNFFANSQNIFSDLTTLSQFSQVGEVQKLLINDFIGTPKLITRINE